MFTSASKEMVLEMVSFRMIRRESVAVSTAERACEAARLETAVCFSGR